MAKKCSQCERNATYEVEGHQKNEAVEHLAFLAAEAAKPKDQRQHSVGRTVSRLPPSGAGGSRGSGTHSRACPLAVKHVILPT